MTRIYHDQLMMIMMMMFTQRCNMQNVWTVDLC